MSSKNIYQPQGGQGDGNDELLTKKHVASYLKVCTKTVDRQIRQLDIPVVQVGRQIRIPARYLPLFLKKKW